MNAFLQTFGVLLFVALGIGGLLLLIKVVDKWDERKMAKSRRDYQDYLMRHKANGKGLPDLQDYHTDWTKEGYNYDS